MPPQTFGNRFLMEFRRLGGSTRNWPGRAVTLLDRAERRQFIKRVSSGASSRLGVHFTPASANDGIRIRSPPPTRRALPAERSYTRDPRACAGRMPRCPADPSGT
jgi:hypothetical protein